MRAAGPPVWRLSAMLLAAQCALVNTSNGCKEAQQGRAGSAARVHTRGPMR